MGGGSTLIGCIIMRDVECVKKRSLPPWQRRLLFCLAAFFWSQGRNSKVTRVRPDNSCRTLNGWSHVRPTQRKGYLPFFVVFLVVFLAAFFFAIALSPPFIP